MFSLVFLYFSLSDQRGALGNTRYICDLNGAKHSPLCSTFCFWATATWQAILTFRTLKRVSGFGRPEWIFVTKNVPLMKKQEVMAVWNCSRKNLSQVRNPDGNENLSYNPDGRNIGFCQKSKFSKHQILHQGFGNGNARCQEEFQTDLCNLRSMRFWIFNDGECFAPPLLFSEEGFKFHDLLTAMLSIIG